ncbi:helix-turn-helix domain-containing protein [Bacillus sp. EB106-08-02-XG196]|uniref:helix-turn-helix domain-containing protein n=1 Tax=Bacillus sp. EB106-08-02-XG196 TaxID=2737049 RepID=UPI0015C475BD|nr:helix-turn-helix domain-containing protein [Bacillus sp. EB106-08-02-XG196]NWQ40375.1 helix-turn-helix domain-containing protein [Bacillus sp. EB106-08-02-XG196]
MTLEFKLGDVLEELEISMNALAVEGKIRPATVSSYVKGDVSRIEVDTLISILDTINRLAIEKRLKHRYGIEDIISYEYK